VSKCVEILQQQSVYSGFFRLERYTIKHTLFAGGWSRPISRELFRRNDCVAVLLYDPQRDAVVMLEQFRIGAILHEHEPWLLEIVAGAIEEGETAREVACRESLEEAGCEVLELEEIMQFYTTPGGSSERITLYYAQVDSSQLGGVHGLVAEDEDILVSVIPAEQVFQLLTERKIVSAIPILALQWLYIHRSRLRQV
jgi:ADP-ribose pyrophosphatase